MRFMIPLLSQKWLWFLSFWIGGCAYQPIVDPAPFQELCKNREEKSCDRLAHYYLGRAQFARAAHFFAQSCYLGNKKSCVELAKWAKKWKIKQEAYAKACEMGHLDSCQAVEQIDREYQKSAHAVKSAQKGIIYYSDVSIINYTTVKLPEQNDLYQFILQGNWYCAQPENEYMEKCRPEQAWSCYHRSECFIVSKNDIVASLRRQLRLPVVDR